MENFEEINNQRRRAVRVRGGGRGGQEGRGQGEGRGGERRRRRRISNEIWAAVVDHVLNHGLNMREAGQRVQPNLSRFTVAAIIRSFRMENRYEIYLPCVLYCIVCLHCIVLPVHIVCNYCIVNMSK